MKIEILNQKIELTNKVNCFIPSDELCEEGLELLYLDLQEIKDSNFVKLNTKEYKSINNQKEYFLNSFHNKEKLNNPNYTLWLYTSNPLYILWLPEDSCVYKIGKNEITKFQSSFYRNLTPNTILTSSIFDFEDLIFKSDLENERLRTEETYKEVKINDETRTFLREMVKKT